MTHEFIRDNYDALKTRPLLNKNNEHFADDLEDLKKHTITNFGFEWLEYARFGWDDPVFNICYEDEIFRRKSLLHSESLDDKLVLDAGCGNGRYSYWAARRGGRVFSLDLGDGVESAKKNLAELPNVQVLQGDIFHMPFAAGVFDVIFSIGVLMHTGNARAATESLAAKLKVNGSLTVHVYGQGNPIYEYLDRVLRKRTTKMSIPELQRFTRRAYRVRRWFESCGLASQADRILRLDPHPHCIFDWYAAPIATHHDYGEVRGWFEDLNMEVVDSAESTKPTSLFKKGVRSLIRRPSVVTVRAKRGM